MSVSMLSLFSDAPWTWCADFSTACSVPGKNIFKEEIMFRKSNSLKKQYEILTDISKAMEWDQYTTIINEEYEDIEKPLLHAQAFFAHVFHLCLCHAAHLYSDLLLLAYHYLR